jgi:hypothetical protein
LLSLPRQLTSAFNLTSALSLLPAIPIAVTVAISLHGLTSLLSPILPLTAIPTIIAISILSLRRCPGHYPDAEQENQRKGRSRQCSVHST